MYLDVPRDLKHTTALTVGKNQRNDKTKVFELLYQSDEP